MIVNAALLLLAGRVVDLIYLVVESLCLPTSVWKSEEVWFAVSVVGSFARSFVGRLNMKA